MAYDIGPKIGIDGEAEFRAQLSNINTSLKTLGTEMKVVTSEFIGQEKSVESLSSQNEVLRKTAAQLEDKLKLQKEMLQKATEAYGEADSRTQKWQQAVNNTTAELNKANAQIKSNEKAVDDLGKEEEDTAKKTDMLGNSVKAAGAALAAMTAAAVAGAVKLGTAVVSSYADYEQLVGGVETLFGAGGQSIEEYAASVGKSVDEVSAEFSAMQAAEKTVLDNANNAYKTAGLSANDYITTVTSFSASLISSLEGDTEAAAKLADQAIIDMSDNANKMGSDIQSLQNAYAGFAKGQFNMLDNLKLGYGGTKTEMERLLKKAEEISGVHYDIESYADIVSAIHIIQDEMGIAGTTADEIEGTISGSISSIQSTIQNLITGLGNGESDIAKLVDDVVTSAANVATNITPVIQSIIAALPGAFDAIGAALLDQLPGLLTTAMGLFNSVLNMIIDSLPALLDVGMEALMMVVDGIIASAPELLTAAVEMITTLVTGIGDALPALIPAAIDAIIQFALGLTSQDSIQNIINAALQLILGLVQGIVKAIPELMKAVPQIYKNIWSALTSPETLKMMADAGIQIVKGLWEGIKGMTAWLWDRVSGFVSGIVDGVKDLLGIHSPSRVFASIGKNMALGLGEGWGDTIEGIKRGMEGSVMISAFAGGYPQMAGMPVGTQGGAEVVINLTSQLDGLTLARNQYRYNMAEMARHGGSLVGGA